MGFLTDIPIGLPGYNAPHPAQRRHPAAHPARRRLQHLRRRQVAPRAALGADRRRGRSTAGRSASASSATTASSTATPTSGRRSWCATTTSSSRRGTPEEGYHLTEDLADQAIRMIQDQQQATPDKPFFLYFAPGAMHAPHHAPRGVDRPLPRPLRRRLGGVARRASSRASWRVGIVPAGTTLTERPAWIPDWGDAARRPAPALRAHDGGVRRLPRAHRRADRPRARRCSTRLGVLDDTLVLLLSDNGASAEGGPIGSFNEHRFIHDQVDDLDGTLAQRRRARRLPRLQPLLLGLGVGRQHAAAAVEALHVARRRAHAADRALAARHRRAAARCATQFCHAVDLMPTILDAAGVAAPDVRRRRRRSSRSTARRCCRRSPTRRRRRRARTQYFEMLGSRAIYHDGWKATTDHVGSQLSVERERVPGQPRLRRRTTGRCSTSSDDFAEAHDVGAEHPERAARADRAVVERGRTQQRAAGARLVPRPRHGARAVAVGPALAGACCARAAGRCRRTRCRRSAAASACSPRSTSASAPRGVICALGDWSNGWACYLLDGRPVITFNILGEVFRYAGDAPLAAGRHALVAEYHWARAQQPHDAARRRHAWSPRARCRAACRSAGRSAAPACSSAATAASRCATTTSRRARSRQRSSASSSRCRHLTPADAVAETAAALHRE